MKNCEHCQHGQQIDHLYDGMERLFDRIERLEARHDREWEEAEQIMDALGKSIGHIQEDIGEIARWRKGIRILTDQSKKPSKCPVCNGRGTLNNFKPIHEGINQIYMPCHSCEGKGIVWG